MTYVQHDGRVALITGASRGIGAAVARLLASRGMRVAVNYRSSRDQADGVVAPGPVDDTSLADAFGQEHKQRQAAQTVLGRIATPGDAARVVAFYAGDDSGFITGTSSPVNGGLVMD